jgi:hypothetical protein
LLENAVRSMDARCKSRSRTSRGRTSSELAT